MQWTWLLMVMVVTMATGCAESAALIGNSASVVVAALLLWSTVNINQNGQ